MQDLDAASVDDVKQFFKTYYAPNNAVLALVGDLDTKETLAKVKKYFGSIPRQTPPAPADLTEPRQGRRAPRQAGRPAGAPHADRYRVSHSALDDAGRARAERGRADSGRRRRRFRRARRRRWRRKQFAPLPQAGAGERAGDECLAAVPTGERDPERSTSPPPCAPARPPQEVEGLIGEEIARLHAEPVTDKELARVRINVRRGAESRLTALSRAQALADAAAVFDDPEQSEHRQRPADGRARPPIYSARRKRTWWRPTAWCWSRAPPAAPRGGAEGRTGRAMKTTIAVGLLLGGAALAQDTGANSFRGMVRLNRAPVSNEVLKVKLPRPVERHLVQRAPAGDSGEPSRAHDRADHPVPSSNLRDGAMPGVAEATAAMMMMGTTTKNARQISEALADIGATVSFGGGRRWRRTRGRRRRAAGGDLSITVNSLTENFDAALAHHERRAAARVLPGRRI